MPKFGELLPADVWAAGTRTLTDISIEELFDLVDIDVLYARVAATSSATADTFGSWVEVSADVGTGKRLLYAVMLVTGALAAAVSIEVEFGEGASGSESRIVGRTLIGAGASYVAVLPIFCNLSDNARLSVRVRDAENVANGHYVNVWIA